MLKFAIIFPLFISVALGQNLGEFRIVDFSAKTPAVVASVSNGIGIVTKTPHGLTTGAAVYIYKPLTLAEVILGESRPSTFINR
jgi:hypothetical protein